MPYEIRKGGGSCAKSQWAVVKKADGESVGCHDTRDSALAQLAALNIHVTGGLMAELKNVEIARIGQWQLASGPLDVTEQMLIDAAAFAQREGARPGYLKIGHTDPRFTGDGEPSLGWLQNLHVEGAGADAALVGDIVDMPDWLAEAAPKHWPDRSMEGWTGYEHGGRTYAMVVDGLALLGVTPPGMSSLRSLRDLPQALGVAASARIVAQAPAPPASPALAPQLPTASAGGSNNTEGGSAVAFSDEQITNLRAKLQLPETADETAILAAVNAVVDESLEEPTPPTPAAAPTPTPAPAAPTATVEPPAEPATPATAPIAAGSGTMVIDAAAWQQREESIKRLEAADAKRRRDERDQVIGQAITAGKFPPVRREHWTRVWDADPEGTRTLIDGLTPNVVPVTAMGEYGTGEDSIDEEFVHLFPPTPNGV